LESTYPIGFARYLTRIGGFRGTLFNDPVAGGYLEFLFPNLRLYGDTRFMAPAPEVGSYLAALSDPGKLEPLAKRFHFDAYLFQVASSPGSVLALLRDPRFVMTYADLHFAFFMRKDSPFSVPLARPHFFDGEDLRLPDEKTAVIRWAQILSYARDSRELWLEALRELTQAPRLPVAVLGYALNYASLHGDADLARPAAAMIPRAVAIFPGEKAELERVVSFPQIRRLLASRPTAP
jgi:hypothetical protein